MLVNRAEVTRIVLAVGYTDLRKGIDGLATLVTTVYDLDVFQKGSLFLFCGRRTDRIKGLYWHGTGFVLLYYRLEAGRFDWPRTPEEARDLTWEQYELLMKGLSPFPKVKEVHPRHVL